MKRYSGRLFTAAAGILECDPIDVLSLEQKKYENIDLRTRRMQAENRPGLVMEFYWDQDKKISVYTGATDILKTSFAELRPLLGSVEVEPAEGAWVGRGYASTRSCRATGSSTTASAGHTTTMWTRPTWPSSSREGSRRPKEASSERPAPILSQPLPGYD